MYIGVVLLLHTHIIYEFGTVWEHTLMQLSVNVAAIYLNNMFMK